MRIRIFQPIVPEYRVALFEGVGKRYGDAVELWAGEGSGQDTSCPMKHMRYDYGHPFLKIGPFVWQRGAGVTGMRRGDVVVISGDVHQLSSIWVALCAKIRRIRVLWWGHHRSATSKGWRVFIRLCIARLLSDSFLCYTRTGIHYLESFGFKRGRVFATGNTIDQAPIKAAIEYWQGRPVPREMISELPYLLCVGVLREKIHLELLLRAMADKRLLEVSLVVIGDGPMKSAWQRLANELGVSHRIKWLPATRDQQVMAPWFIGAKAFVYPGSIGLSILHSFSYGLPVITHSNVDHQMPEFEVMEDGKTGLCFEEGNSDDLICKIATILADGTKRRSMAEFCKRIVVERYTMAQMIENYCEAIDRTAAVGQSFS